MSKKLTIKEMQDIAKTKGGTCLSKKYIDTHIRLRWRCKKGHIWDAMPYSVKNGHWCPKCLGLKKLTTKEMHEFAKAHEGRCLSKTYINNRTKLKWQCKEGHVWEAAPHNIVVGHWCPICGGSERLTIEEMRKLAKSRGGECLSRKYVNVETKLKWRCKEGHIWEAAPNDIRNGRWCSFCLGGIGRSEKICRKHFEIIFDEKFLKKKPRWLTFRGTRLELDGYCEKLKLAFEYQGAQHYKKVDFFIRKLKLQKEYDHIKTRLCRNNGVTLIKIPYTVKFEKMADYIIEKCRRRKIRVPKITKSLNYKLFNVYSPEMLNEMQELAKSRGGKCLSTAYIDSKTKLEWQCKKGHVWTAIPNDVKNGHWCPDCIGLRKLTIGEMQKLANARGGECLSLTYFNSRTKLKWRCKNGHIWEAKPIAIRVGYWCPKCAGKQKLTIQEMQGVAKSRCGKCLSKKYVDSKTKLRWQCKKGHIWMATPGHIKRGSWCPECVGLRKLTIGEMRKIAKSRGGKCLSKRYVNVDTKLKWRCKYGHEWKATPYGVKSGQWCPICARKRTKNK